MINEIHTDLVHYFLDAQGCRHGEFKCWNTSGKLSLHCFYVNGKAHGEFKAWNENGIRVHCFFVDDHYTSFDEIPYPQTPEDRMLFLLKYDLQLLPMESVC